jgi:hypothetical protein
MIKHFGPQLDLTPQGRQILHDIGELAAFDVLLNNSDRLPFVADNEGNPGNLMFSTTDGSVLSLDNLVVQIDPFKNPDALKSYITTVSHVIKNLIEKPRVPLPAVKKIETFIHSHSNYKLFSEGCVEIQKGILSFIDSCGSIELDDIKEIKKTIEEIGTDIVGLSDIGEEYLEIMLQVFKKKGQVDPVQIVDDFIMEKEKEKQAQEKIERGPPIEDFQRIINSIRRLNYLGNQSFQSRQRRVLQKSQSTIM